MCGLFSYCLFRTAVDDWKVLNLNSSPQTLQLFFLLWSAALQLEMCTKVVNFSKYKIRLREGFPRVVKHELDQNIVSAVALTVICP